MTALLITALLSNTAEAAPPVDLDGPSFTIIHTATDYAGIEAEILAALEAHSQHGGVEAPSAAVEPPADGILPPTDEEPEVVLTGDYTRCYYRSDKHYTCCTYYESGTTWCKDYRYECYHYGSGGYRYARGSTSSHCGWRAYDGYHDCSTQTY